MGVSYSLLFYIFESQIFPGGDFWENLFRKGTVVADFRLAMVIFMVLFVVSALANVYFYHERKIRRRKEKRGVDSCDGELHIILDKSGDDVMMLETNAYPRELAKKDTVTFAVILKRN